MIELQEDAEAKVEAITQPIVVTVIIGIVGIFLAALFLPTCFLEWVDQYRTKYTLKDVLAGRPDSFDELKGILRHRSTLGGVYTLCWYFAVCALIVIFLIRFNFANFNIKTNFMPMGATDLVQSFVSIRATAAMDSSLCNGNSITATSPSLSGLESTPPGVRFVLTTNVPTAGICVAELKTSRPVMLVRTGEVQIQFHAYPALVKYEIRASTGLPHQASTQPQAFTQTHP